MATCPSVNTPFSQPSELERYLLQTPLLCNFITYTTSFRCSDYSFLGLIMGIVVLMLLSIHSAKKESEAAPGRNRESLPSTRLSAVHLSGQVISI